MTHTILHKLRNGGVASYPPNPKVITLMTEKGFGWSNERVAWEVYKLMLPAVDAGWSGFSEEFAQEWASAIGYGSLSEVEAFALFTKRIQLRHNYLENALIDVGLLPSHIRGDRYFRDAIMWDDTIPNRCRLDMPKARIIHMDHIRTSRDEELEKLDVSYIRADEVRDLAEKGRIAALKQDLRDLPTTFDLNAFLTPDTLKDAWPTELPAR